MLHSPATTKPSSIMPSLPQCSALTWPEATGLSNHRPWSILPPLAVLLCLVTMTATQHIHPECQCLILEGLSFGFSTKWFSNWFIDITCTNFPLLISRELGVNIPLLIHKTSSSFLNCSGPLSHRQEMIYLCLSLHRWLGCPQLIFVKGLLPPSLMLGNSSSGCVVLLRRWHFQRKGVGAQVDTWPGLEFLPPVFWSFPVTLSASWISNSLQLVFPYPSLLSICLACISLCLSGLRFTAALEESRIKLFTHLACTHLYTENSEHHLFCPLEYTENCGALGVRDRNRDSWSCPLQGTQRDMYFML